MYSWELVSCVPFKNDWFDHCELKTREWFSWNLGFSLILRRMQYNCLIIQLAKEKPIHDIKSIMFHNGGQCVINITAIVINGILFTYFKWFNFLKLISFFFHSIYYIAEPIPLKDIARRMIRKQLGRHRLHMIETKFDLPSILTDYLQYKDQVFNLNWKPMWMWINQKFAHTHIHTWQKHISIVIN